MGLLVAQATRLFRPATRRTETGAAARANRGANRGGLFATLLATSGRRVVPTSSRERVARATHFQNTLLLSGHEHNYDDVRCAEFGLWQGARREHIPKWICDRRATQPQAKFGATLRAAVLFQPDFVARSSQTPEGYAPRSRLVWPKNPSPRTSS